MRFPLELAFLFNSIHFSNLQVPCEQQYIFALTIYFSYGLDNKTLERRLLILSSL